MRAMRLSRFQSADDNPLISVELPVPEPGTGQVGVKVYSCGVCRTDLHTVEGEIIPPRLPITPGHQVVGQVDRVGSEVTRYHAGDWVGVPWLYSTDRNCEYCQKGQENLCPQARFTGFHVDGGYAEYILAEADYVLPLPVEINPKQAAPLLCAGIIGYRSLRLSEVKPGEKLGLVGFGASAHLAIQIARFWNCEVYIFTRSPSHQEHARELGATWVGDIKDKIPTKLDRAVLFAPVGKLVPEVLAMLRPGGTLAINAAYMSPIPQMEYHLLYGERTVRSVANATFQDGIDLLKLAVEIPITATVAEYDLLDANQALQDVKYSRIDGEAVLRILS